MAPDYGAEWPTATYYPNAELGDGQQLSIDGLTITARELGPGESHADSILLVQPAGQGGAPLAFTGDLAFHHTFPYTADGHTSAWLATLDGLAGVRRLLPGHGAPTGPGLLAEQRRYLLFYREVVGRLADGAPKLSDAAKSDLEAMMRRFLPDAPLTWKIGPGGDAVAAELAAEADRLTSGPES